MQPPDDFWIVTAVAERTTADLKGLDGLLQLIRGLRLLLKVAMDLAAFVVPVPGEKIWRDGVRPSAEHTLLVDGVEVA
jgi:hypothetical protein